MQASTIRTKCPSLGTRHRKRSRLLVVRANTLTRTDVRNWAFLSPSPSTSETERCELAINGRIICAAMTTIESGEQALLKILSAHLEVTEKLLEDYLRLVAAVRQQRETGLSIQQIPKLRELHTSTSQLRQRVQSTLGQK